jgi:hypothetical protein
MDLSWLDLQLILQLPIATVAQIAGRNSLPDLIHSLNCPGLVFDWLITLMPIFGRHDAYLPSLLMAGAVLQHWESFSIAELSDLNDIRPICLDSFIPNSPPERPQILPIYPVRSLAQVRSDSEVAEFVSDFSELALCGREVYPQISHQIWLSSSFARPLSSLDQFAISSVGPTALTIPRLHSRTPVPYADLFAVDDFLVLIIRCLFHNSAPLIHFSQCGPHSKIVPDAVIAFENIIPPFSIRIFARPFIPLDVGLALPLPLSIPMIPEWLSLP